MAEKRFSNTVNIRNKQASFQYELLDKFVAGIVLQGTEIKSIREGKVNLQDGYCYFSKGEFFAKGINITPYAQGTHYNHEAARERKLLMKKSELSKLEAKSEEKGLALVPLRLSMTEVLLSWKLRWRKEKNRTTKEILSRRKILNGS